MLPQLFKDKIVRPKCRRRQSAGGLEGAGEEGFEERFGRLFRDGGDFDFGEAGALEEGVEGALLEAEPDVGVEFAGFFEIVLVEVEDEELAAGFQNAEGFLHGGLGVLGVVQRLREDREIDGAVGERDLLDVAELVGEVFEAVFLGEFGADLDHARRVVDAPDLVGAAGEELRNETFASAEVGDVDGGGEAEGEMADGFPRAAGAVVFPEAAGDEVEILLLGATALLEDAVEVVAVLGDDRLVGDGVDRGAQEGEGFGRKIRAERVEGLFAVAAVGHEIDLAEERELRRDARLAHAENLLELGDGEFLAQEQGQQAQAGGVGEGFKDVPGGVHRVATVGTSDAEGNGAGDERGRRYWRVVEKLQAPRSKLQGNSKEMGGRFSRVRG